MEREAVSQQVQNDSPVLICIGETTADAARKYSDHIVIANTTLVESVIAKAVNVLKKD
jgi:uroporphyrinogen-III synthase